ncbi:hypothetical protein OC861_003940 [Tilletia horrida]|nr:hypothetical protein OC861_003940 [Tilletia horrida]
MAPVEEMHAVSVATDPPRQVKIQSKSAATVKKSLRDLILSVTSSDAVQRNSAINNCFASQAAWEIRPGIVIHGAARIKHVLDAVNHLTISSKPARILSPEVTWDAPATTVQLVAARSVRPIFFPFIEFSVPVKTTLVLNADSEPDAGRAPQTLSATRGASINVDRAKLTAQPTDSTFLVTKWQDEWPLFGPIDSAMAGPLNVYLWMFRTYLIPLALTLFVIWAELLFWVEQRIRRAKNTGTRVAMHCVDRALDFINGNSHATEQQSTGPSQPIQPRADARAHEGGFFATVKYYAYGPARIFKSSTQLLIESLNDLLPTRAQLPSPRVLDWFEQQHASSLQRRQSIHEIRKRRSTETDINVKTAPEPILPPPDPQERRSPQPAATSGASLSSAWYRDTSVGHSSTTGVHIPLARSAEEASGISDEAASQPEHKRVRRESAAEHPENAGSVGSSPHDPAETATVSSVASSLASSSRKGRTRKTVTFTSGGLVPLPTMDSGAGTSLSPATKTTHTSIDPYAAAHRGIIGDRAGSLTWSSGSRSSFASFPGSVSDPGSVKGPPEHGLRRESRLLGDPIHLSGPLDLAHHRPNRVQGQAAGYEIAPPGHGKVTEFGQHEHRAHPGRYAGESALSDDSVLAARAAIPDASEDALRGQESDPGAAHDQDWRSISSSSSGRFRAKMKEKVSKWRSRHGRST